MYVSAAGAHALSRKVDMLSNNLANVGTDGFKRELSLLEARDAEAIERGEVARGSHGLDDLSGGVHLTLTPVDYSPGAMRVTNRQADLAIERPSDFFLVERNGQEFLSRAGSFRFTVDGKLVTQDGDAVMRDEGGPIVIDPTLPWQMLPGGFISQGGEAIPVALRRPVSLGHLKKAGAHLFDASETTLETVPVTDRTVRHGVLEASGVNPTSEMVELIAASRAYEANIRMIQHHDSILSNLVGRVLRA
jgi:flagellar basal body rod protein FlgG